MKHNLDNHNVDATSSRVILVVYNLTINTTGNNRRETVTDNQTNAEQTDGQLTEATIKQDIQPAVSRAIHRAFHDAARQAIQSLPDGLGTGSGQTDDPT